MKYLADANLLSEPTKPAPNSRALNWLQAHESEIVIDPLILGELRFGILKLSKGKARTQLEQWFETVVRAIECLPWDAQTGISWADLVARLRVAGKAMPIKDSLIAATALANGLAIATRNCADFENTGLDVVNPFGD